MKDEGELYGCLCTGDARMIGPAIERGLVAAAVRAADLGERGPPIEKAVSDATRVLEGLAEADVGGPLALSRTFDEPLPLEDALVDQGVLVFVGDPAGQATGSAAFLIRPSGEDREALARRFVEVADRMAELAESLRTKVLPSG